jgi:hypothetical protein
MKIRVVSSKKEINSLKKSEDLIHLTFRPSNIDILNLIQRCPNLKIIHMPKSYSKNISLFTQLLLEMQNIAFLIGDVWRHRKDINEYYKIKPQVFVRINKRVKGCQILKL